MFLFFFFFFFNDTATTEIYTLSLHDALPILLPIGIYIYMMWKSSISRTLVLLLGIVLIVVSGIDIFLLQRLAVLTKTTPSLFDDKIFASELSVAFYLLPLLFAGI